MLKTVATSGAQGEQIKNLEEGHIPHKADSDL